MQRKFISKALLATSIIWMIHPSFAEPVNRFSVSAGWLHVMPQGKANPFNINTQVDPTTSYSVGTISRDEFFGALDPNFVTANQSVVTQARSLFYDELLPGLTGAQFLTVTTPDGKQVPIADAEGNLNAAATGTTTVNGIDQWHQADSGLEADDVDALGLMFNYYINDNVSLQLIGGLPPKVDVKGKGQIVAPLTGTATPNPAVGALFPNGQLDLQKNIPITDLESPSTIATVRAWTPALEAQYQFGKPGVNKFRPYIGAGVMYAHFGSIKLNGQTKSDLIAAGHMIQNVLDDKAGAALEGQLSSADPTVKVKTTNDIAPMVSIGATYDITPNWYGVASVSYAKLNNIAKIDVTDSNTGNHLIHATTKIDVDPLITFLGVGYRF